ncbi:hypothetical protein K440DRAFT_646186 [Wilcoxina mikolae CBS 423.85]|nr:hypothetical protein K440DRAFT_646186 [Wilcoxina mikolae CBS 423.85]
MAISQIDCGRDVVIVAPTGRGKSMVFQGLALKDDRNIVFVIAPINAHMTDQVDNLSRKGVKACYLNSYSRKDNPGLVKEVARGVYQIVYAGPEMTSPNKDAIWPVLDDEKSAFRRSLKVVVVDEAH